MSEERVACVSRRDWQCCFARLFEANLFCCGWYSWLCLVGALAVGNGLFLVPAMNMGTLIQVLRLVMCSYGR